MVLTRRQSNSSLAPSSRKRRAGPASSAPSSPSKDNVALLPQTPRRKRVRFSDVRPDYYAAELPATPPATGLTPFIRRAALGPGPRDPSPRPRAASLPVHLPMTPPSSPLAEVYYPPLRESLTPRTRRQLRRSHLSEEQNAITIDERREKRENATLRSQVRTLEWELESERQRSIGVWQEDDLGFRDLQKSADGLASPTTTEDHDDADTIIIDSNDVDNDDTLRMSTPSFQRAVAAAGHHFVLDAGQDGGCQVSLPDVEHEKRVQELMSEISQLTQRTVEAQRALESCRKGLVELGLASGVDDPVAALKSALLDARLQLEQLIPGETECGSANLPVLLKALLSHIASLHAREQQAAADCGNAAAHNAALDARLLSTTAHRDGLQVELHETHGRLDAVESHRTELILAVSTLESQVEQFDHDLASKQVELEALQAQVQDLTHAGEEQALATRRHTQALGRYRDDVKQMQDMINHLEEEGATLFAEKQEAESQRQSLEAVLDRASKGVEEYAYGLVALFRPGMAENVSVRRRRGKQVVDDATLETPAETEAHTDLPPIIGLLHGDKARRPRDSGVELL